MPTSYEVMIAGQLYIGERPSLLLRGDLAAALDDAVASGGAGLLSIACATLGSALAPQVKINRRDLHAYGDAVFEAWSQVAAPIPTSAAREIVERAVELSRGWTGELGELFREAEDLSGNSASPPTEG